MLGCIQPEVYAAEHERVKRKPPQSLDAWESFIRAMFLYSQHSDASTREALTLLDHAVGMDPSYAQAHGLRAVCLAWRAFQGWEDRGDGVRRSRRSGGARHRMRPRRAVGVSCSRLHRHRQAA